jgi:hypothetical protein
MESSTMLSQELSSAWSVDLVGCKEPGATAGDQVYLYPLLRAG